MPLLYCFRCKRGVELSLELSAECPSCHSQTVWLSKRPEPADAPLTFNDKAFLRRIGVEAEEPVKS